MGEHIQQPANVARILPSSIYFPVNGYEMKKCTSMFRVHCTQVEKQLGGAYGTRSATCIYGSIYTNQTYKHK